jgi:hypothetical protein
LAGNWGVTVRCGVVVVAGFDTVEELAVPVGFAVVLVVLAAAARDAVAYAAQMRDDEKLRCESWYANGAALDEEADRRAETLLQAGIAAILDK